MAKSKQQKQLEAIERKRQHLSYQRQVYLEAQWGSQTYNKKLQVIPQEKLDQQAAEAKRIFLKACAEAQVDAHGNPLPGSPGYNDPGLVFGLDARVEARNALVGALDELTDGRFSKIVGSPVKVTRESLLLEPGVKATVNPDVDLNNNIVIN